MLGLDAYSFVQALFGALNDVTFSSEDWISLM